MAKLLRQIGTVSGVTALSRVLGLVRDMLLAGALGAGGLGSVFLLAFTIPNLFRRLFGEGALTSAFIPVLAEAREKGGQAAAFEVFNRVASRFLGLLAVLLLIAGLLAWNAGLLDFLPPRWREAGRLTAVLLPYGLLICLAALLAAALNVWEKFAVAAVAQLGLNLAMIAGLALFGFTLAETPEQRVAVLVSSVLVGGVLQVALPWVALRREGWRGRLDFTRGARVREVERLFLPGVAGAAVYQVNVVFSQFLAFGISEAGVALLYFSNRLVQLPLGVFVIAVLTVLFPEISRAAARGDRAGFRARYEAALTSVYAVTLPAAVGLAVLALPIVRLLFERGAFDAGDAAATAPILAIHSLSLPFLAQSIVAARGFHALKDTAAPVRWGMVSFLVNAAVALSLAPLIGVAGLAWANVLAAAVQGLAMEVHLRRRMASEAEAPSGQAGIPSAPGFPYRTLGCLVASALGMGLALSLLVKALEGGLPAGTAGTGILLAVAVPAGAALYAAALFALRIPELEPLLRRIRGG